MCFATRADFQPSLILKLEEQSHKVPVRVGTGPVPLRLANLVSLCLFNRKVMQKPQKTLDVVSLDVMCFDEEVLLEAKPSCEASHHFLADRLAVLH
jgi:hypothetical protein